MIISHKYKLIFVKTKKTSGSTLEFLLSSRLGPKDICTGSERDGTSKVNTNISNGHMNLSKIKKIFPKEFENYYKFSIERNPWDKVVSSYFWHNKVKPEKYAGMDFTKYMIAAKGLPVGWKIYTIGGEIAADKVFFYENLNEMYNELNRQFDLQITPEEIRDTRKKSGIRKVGHYSELHNEETIEIVKKRFADEIKAFSYTY